MYIQISCPFVKFDNFFSFTFLLLSYLRFLYILDVKPLSDRIGGLEIHFPIPQMSLHCAVCFLCCAEAFSLMLPYYSLLVSFFFYYLCFWCQTKKQNKTKKSLPRRISRHFNPLFSSNRLTVADLMLKYFIHFELIQVVYLRYFFFSQCKLLSLQTFLLELLLQHRISFGMVYFHFHLSQDIFLFSF